MAWLFCLPITCCYLLYSLLRLFTWLSYDTLGGQTLVLLMVSLVDRL